MLTAHGLETIRGIALQTRKDFEEGRLSNEEIIETAVALGAVSLIATVHKSGYENDTLIELTDIPSGKKGMSHFVRRRLDKPSQFPEAHCGSASVILAQRINDRKLLDKPVELIRGGCGTIRPLRAYCLLLNHNPHIFDGIGETEGTDETGPWEDTIVDITGDQFGEVEPVYIGPLEEPWTRGAPNYNPDAPVY